MSRVSNIIDNYTNGHMTREQLVDQLSSFTYATPDKLEDDEDDSVPYDKPNTFDEVRRAHFAGRIDNTTYQEILTQIFATRKRTG